MMISIEELNKKFEILKSEMENKHDQSLSPVQVSAVRERFEAIDNNIAALTQTVTFQSILIVAFQKYFETDPTLKELFGNLLKEASKEIMQNLMHKKLQGKE